MPIETELSQINEAEVWRIARRVDPALAAVSKMTIATEAEMHYMENEQANFKACSNAVHDYIDPYIKAAKARHSDLLALRHKMTEPLKKGFTITQNECTRFVVQERSRVARENAIAEERARAEKERVDLQEAVMIEEESGKQAADEFLEKVDAQPAPVVVVQDVPKSSRKGTAMRKYYSAVVVDEDKVPSNFLMVDQKHLDSEARSMKERFDVSGCKLRVKEKHQVHA